MRRLLNGLFVIFLTVQMLLLLDANYRTQMKREVEHLRQWAKRSPEKTPFRDLPKYGKEIFSAPDIYEKFKFILEPNVCQDGKGNNLKIYLLVLILSSADHFDRRMTIRSGYGSIPKADGHEIRYVFLTARTSNDAVHAKLSAEAEQENDIVQLDFIDTYRHLTNKTLGGLQWAVEKCPGARYVLKTDDDVAVLPERVVRFLKRLSPSEEAVLYTGQPTVTYPNRHEHHRWYVSRELYPYDIYPRYNQGLGILMSRKVVETFIILGRKFMRIPAEDAFLGLLAYAAGIPATCNRAMGYAYLSKRYYAHCRYAKFMLILTVGEEEGWVKFMQGYKKGNDTDCLKFRGHQYSGMCSRGYPYLEIDAELKELH